jgi:hypothetical protein
LVSTYQAGQLIAIGVVGAELSFSFRRFDQAMGVASAQDRLAGASRDQIWLLHDLKCGVGVIEVATGNTVATLEFTTGVEEIFDVQIVPGARCPTFGSPSGEAGDVCLLPGRTRSVLAES